MISFKSDDLIYKIIKSVRDDLINYYEKNRSLLFCIYRIDDFLKFTNKEHRRYKMKQKCILILGMRSGTSALAGCLHKYGIFMGSNLDGPQRGNIKGQFENRDIMVINNRILSSLGVSWNHPNLYDKIMNSEDEIMKHLEEVIAYLQKEYGKSEIFGIKEPRIGLLLPLYIKALKELEDCCEIKIIYSKRNPTHIAQSLEKRDGINFQSAMNLVSNWQAIMYDHIINTVGINNVYGINFKSFMNDPTKILFELDCLLEIGFYDFTKDKEIEEFIDPKLINF